MMETPEEALSRLKDGVSRRKADSLDHLYRICEEQRARGSTDFSNKTIGRLSKGADGLGPRAIVNPKGQVYRQLLEAYRSASTPKCAKKAGVESWIEAIGDFVLRARVESLRDQLRYERRQGQLLREVANKNTTVTLEVNTGEVEAISARLGRHERIALLPAECEALSRGLDPARLKKLGLVVDERGRIYDRANVELFPIGFVTALQKILAAQVSG